ncbi:hypothetical protein [Thermococcus gorgonarius]|uniref:hypothetical protein n=1 Tax=Thermococcus gorgonarius TaxID=71997 RepID=UPI0012FD6665|nr:hypothetical protein [Thermococcus gorgonarius]
MVRVTPIEYGETIFDTLTAEKHAKYSSQVNSFEPYTGRITIEVTREGLMNLL